MLISASDWERYVNRLAAIDESVARQMRAYIEVNGYNHPDDIINIAYQLSTKYGEAAAEATCEMYDAIAAAQGVNVPAAEPARTPSLEETRDMIERVLDITHPEEYSKTVPAETSKLVKKTSTRTMRKNAARDGAKMALIPSGDGCAFCKMLGSRGWEDARSSKSFEAHLHAHCRCEYCVRFNNDLSVDGYDPDELLEEYNSTGGKNSKEKLNLMRKAYREEHKDEINAQKRSNYDRDRRLKYGEEAEFTTDGGKITARKVDRYGYNNIFVDDQISLTERELRNIDKQISSAKEVLGISNTCNVPVLITDLGNERLASYNPHRDQILINSKMSSEADVLKMQQGFACANDPRSTAVHELFHWEDAERYRQSVGEINDASPLSVYSVYQRNYAWEKMSESGIDLSDQGELLKISQYASAKAMDNNWEEVYTEFRTQKVLEP